MPIDTSFKSTDNFSNTDWSVTCSTKWSSHPHFTSSWTCSWHFLQELLTTIRANPFQSYGDFTLSQHTLAAYDPSTGTYNYSRSFCDNSVKSQKPAFLPRNGSRLIRFESTVKFIRVARQGNALPVQNVVCKWQIKIFHRLNSIFIPEKSSACFILSSTVDKLHRFYPLRRRYLVHQGMYFNWAAWRKYIPKRGISCPQAKIL